MRLLIYATESGLEHVGNLIGGGRLPAWTQLNLFSEIEAMSAWLRVRPRGFQAAVLLPDDADALVRLAQLHDYFEGRKIILFCPHSEGQNWLSANMLRPTYCFSSFVEFANIPSVLQTIAKTTDKAGYL